MFTGLVTDVGKLELREANTFTIASHYPAREIEIGASICCDGCCLTVTHLEPTAHGCRFRVDVSNETLSKTALRSWAPGHAINLERSLGLGDEMGGHVVTGHVDGTAEVVEVKADGDSRRFTFSAPEHLARYIAPKGSVALNGTSLTVNEVCGSTFGVNLIPHTLTVTTWGATTPGQFVNLEVDLFARYVARLMEFRQ